MQNTSQFRRVDTASHPLPTGLLVATAGKIFVFNRTGRAVWEALAQPQALPALCAHLAAHHALTETHFRAEVVPFVEQLHSVGLVETVDA
ncbi:MAG: PqqD family protein [Anaerolineales bacterium]|nr:PqqD family protein [Anaerolineales bacterium]